MFKLPQLQIKQVGSKIVPTDNFVRFTATVIGIEDYSNSLMSKKLRTKDVDAVIHATEIVPLQSKLHDQQEQKGQKNELKIGATIIFLGKVLKPGEVEGRVEIVTYDQKIKIDRVMGIMARITKNKQ